MTESARGQGEAKPVFSLGIRAMDATARGFLNSLTFP